MHFGELPRPELVIRVVPGPVVPDAKRNGGQIGGLLAQTVRPGMGPRPHASCGTRNREGPGSTAGILGGGMVSPSTPPQRVPPDHQANSGDVRTAIDRRLNRAFIHADLGAPYLSENRGALLDL